jgi:dienelactone hydrolase
MPQPFPEQRPIWRREPLWLVAAGLLWLEHGTGESGWIPVALGSVPGLLLLGSGVSCWLWPGDPRQRHFGAVGALLGLVVGVVSWSWLGLGGAVLMVTASGVAAAAIGLLALRLQEPEEDVPDPGRSLRTALEVALDSAVLAQVTITAPPRALRGDGERVAAEVHEALAFYRDRGFLEKPESYHASPPPLEQVELRPARVLRVSFEHLRFESGYEPHEGEPGRERYLSYVPPRTGHAWVLRRGDPDRPWLVCIHGYQMGKPAIDFGAFRPGWLHDELGLNLLLPVLPLHGPRSIRRMSGDGFLSGDLLDTVHALAQTAWDLRRLVSWVRAQGATRVGVFGLSLGGYGTALLASFEPELACAIAGIPATDFARLSWRHAPPDSIRRAEEQGVGLGETTDLKRVVSPLALAPRVAFERRYIFGGSADQLVPPDQVRDLWRHWARPKVCWYPGAHVTFEMHREVRRFIVDALRESGLTGGNASLPPAAAPRTPGSPAG